MSDKPQTVGRKDERSENCDPWVVSEPGSSNKNEEEDDEISECSTTDPTGAMVPPPRPQVVTSQQPTGAVIQGCMQQSTRIQARSLMWKAWKGSRLKCDYISLLSCLIGKINPHTSPAGLQSWTSEQYAREQDNVLSLAFMLLGQVHEDVVDCLIRGDLPYQWEAQPRLRQHVYRFQVGQNDPSGVVELPCVYINIVHQIEKGRGMSGEHLNRLCEKLELLGSPTETDEVKALVEQLRLWLCISRPKTDEVTGVFHHCRGSPEGKSEEQLRMDHRSDTLELARSLRALGQNIPEHGLTMTETGASITGARTRLTTYASYDSTLLYLTLARGILHLCFAGKFKMSQYIVLFPRSNWNLLFGETLISNLTCSYIKAGGCNHVESGTAPGIEPDQFWAQSLKHSSRQWLDRQADETRARFMARMQQLQTEVDEELPHANKAGTSKRELDDLKAEWQRCRADVQLAHDDFIAIAEEAKESNARVTERVREIVSMSKRWKAAMATPQAQVISKIADAFSAMRESAQADDMKRKDAPEED